MTSPQKYRKKPVTIEAMEWDGTAQGATPIIDWILSTGDRAAHYDESFETFVAPNGKTIEGQPASIYINTLEGTMQAIPGDFIIKGVHNEFYPCKPDIFELTYEKA